MTSLLIRIRCTVTFNSHEKELVTFTPFSGRQRVSHNTVLDVEQNLGVANCKAISLYILPSSLLSRMSQSASIFCPLTSEAKVLQGSYQDLLSCASVQGWAQRRFIKNFWQEYSKPSSSFIIKLPLSFAESSYICFSFFLPQTDLHALRTGFEKEVKSMMYTWSYTGTPD